MEGTKGSFSEGGLGVPAIISYQKMFAKGEVRNQAITSLDFFPTICDVLNIPTPENKLDGTSILPLLQSADAPESHKVLYWIWQDMWTVRKGGWKLIFKRHDTIDKYSIQPEKQFQMPEYYLANLNDKSPEEINHASEHHEIERELTSLHEKWVEDIFKNTGIPNPDKTDVKKVHEVGGTNTL
ncbi:MAG: hypothetical protein Q8T08_21215 [Ignavibacteria bacterium]|nr:hypothetical protein [Ignavibacteria bacterium]